MKRRTFLQRTGIALLALHPATALLAENKQGSFRLTDKQWRERLTEFEYAVMRLEKTEIEGSSPLLNEKRKGIYHCKGCDLALYDSKTKYDSGTGWPSFYQALPNVVGTKEDNSLFITRTEVHCSRCLSHLGHIFDDGPKPTGERHCLNGVSLIFKPA